MWLECQALVASGYRVSVICPKGPGDAGYQELDGVQIHKYAAAPDASGFASYMWEFAYSWLRTLHLAIRVARKDSFGIVQACNPPDTYWLLALLFRPFGVRFVYDQHDLNPEVFESRFGRPKGLVARLQYRALLWLEHRTYRLADHVIATNESYKQIAVNRGGLAPADVTVVRSGPDTTRMRPLIADPAVHGNGKLLVYLGIMGPQDGVDIVLRAADILVNKMGRTDVRIALLGFGDCLDDLKQLATELGLDDYVTFTGRVGPTTIAEYLSAADIGLGPDPLNALNDVSTMNKTMEYMSYAVPVVTFDLKETRVSGGDAAVYVEPAGAGGEDAAVERFADQIDALLDDPDRRARMGLAGRRRAETVLDWRPQREKYVSVFNRLSGRRDEAVTEQTPDSPIAHTDRLVNITDDEIVLSYVRDRGIKNS